MRRRWLTLLALVCAVCLLCAGCGSAGTAGTSDPGSSSGADSSDGDNAGAGSSGAGDVSVTDPEPVSDAEDREPGVGEVITGLDTADAAGEEVEVDSVGKLRITYTGNRSGAVYVTDASQLPEYSELAGYDDAYFEDHALVLVTETVTSGSVDVGIAAVHVDGQMAAVTLYHEEPEPGRVNTTDMATWLLWAEVEPGLEGCTWTVANPALRSGLEAY